MSSQPDISPPVRMDLTSRYLPSIGAHKRTAFILSTPGRPYGDLVAMCNTPLARETGGNSDGIFTIRHKFPDTKFVEILPPFNTRYSVFPEQLGWWFFEDDLNWSQSGYLCDPPQLGTAIQAVIDFIFIEKYKCDIPLANMLICGIGQAGTVALGVVIACGIEPIRYVGIDAKFPTLSETQPIVELMGTLNAQRPLSMFTLTMRFCIYLKLTVSDPTHNDGKGTKKSGGLITMIHHPRTETPDDKAHRNLALKTLASCGYNTRLGYCRTTSVTPAHSDNLFSLFMSMMDDLTHMTKDTGIQAPRGIECFLPTHVNMQDVHNTPVPVRVEEHRPIDLTAVLQNTANNGQSQPQSRLTPAQLDEIRRVLLQNRDRSVGAGATPSTTSAASGPQTATTGKVAAGGTDSAACKAATGLEETVQPSKAQTRKTKPKTGAKPQKAESSAASSNKARATKATSAKANVSAAALARRRKEVRLKAARLLQREAASRR